MIKSVVRTFQWTPEVIDNLYFDDIDYHGLIFWYNDVIEVSKEIKGDT